MKCIGILLLVLSAIFNPYFLERFFSNDRYLEPGKKVFILLLESACGMLGVTCLLWGGKISSYLRARKAQIVLMFCAVSFTLVGMELALRMYLFYCPYDFLRLKLPSLYTAGQGDSDFWYYNYLWRDRSLLTGSSAQHVKHGSKEFYDNWAVSLEFDPLLGYRRKAHVTVPGHETSNLGTRGLHDYKMEGPKIVFYGDSFVESNAFSSDTLTAKIEKKAGLDCLNYGVGGYGLDQIYLLFEETYGLFDGSQTQFLIGVIGDDLQRMLLKIRQSSKPYYTVHNNDLVLHKDHIDAQNPRRSLALYRPHFRSFLMELILKQIRPLNDLLASRRERAEDSKIRELTALLVEKIKRSGRDVTFVIFYDWRDNMLRDELKKQGMPFIGLQDCIKNYAARTHVSEQSLFPAGHPSSELNDAIAEYILERMKIAKKPAGKV